MSQSILLCDRQWQIAKVLACDGAPPFAAGESLLERTEEPETLRAAESLLESRKQSVFTLRFKAAGSLTTIAHVYPKYYLLFLVCVENAAEFARFADSYMKTLAWADENVQVPFSDEYFRIEQMNNQLVNAKRALTKSNMKLQRIVEQMREANDAIALLERDELTNLFSAPAFYRRAQKRLEERPQTEYDFIAVDIAHFKLVNEIFGRDAGDRMLQNMALAMLGMEHAGEELFARAGGDTFYIMAESGARFYDALARTLDEFFKTYPLPVHVREKIGVYKVQRQGVPVERMCDRARLAMAEIHVRDEERIAFYNQSLHDGLLISHDMADKTREAIRNGEFKLYLQKKVDMATGETIGAEALIRWVHPEMGMIPPDRFIPLLEKEGCIYQVDQFIWEETCKVLKRRRELGLKRLPISVNVARNDLYEKDLCATLEGLLQTYSLEPRDLRLEIIERAYANDADHLFEVLGALRKKGFWIEMDDFGTGESSLAMAADMPVNVIKLDRRFVVAGQRDKRGAEVIRFIINLAKTLDMDIIAEGVENEEQAGFLLKMGCRFAQGYLYGRPEPAEKFLV